MSNKLDSNIDSSKLDSSKIDNNKIDKKCYKYKKIKPILICNINSNCSACTHKTCIKF
jgi:hypothetical protein